MCFAQTQGRSEEQSRRLQRLFLQNVFAHALDLDARSARHALAALVASKTSSRVAALPEVEDEFNNADAIRKRIQKASWLTLGVGGYYGRATGGDRGGAFTFGPHLYGGARLFGSRLSVGVLQGISAHGEVGLTLGAGAGYEFGHRAVFFLGYGVRVATASDMSPVRGWGIGISLRHAVKDGHPQA